MRVLRKILRRFLAVFVALGMIGVFQAPLLLAKSESAGGAGGGGGKGAGGYHGSGGAGHGSSAEKDVFEADEEGDGDSEGERGAKGNKGGGSRGGKPVWAQEGIPEVELGRLSVARSPSHVLDKALAEALKNINPTLYELPLDQVIAAITTGTYTDGTAVVRVDSPLENLGLYKDLLSDGVLADGTVIDMTSTSVLDVAAIFLGGASDKTIPISIDTVVAINTILGVSMTDAQVAELADKAEDVRVAILTEHG